MHHIFRKRQSFNNKRSIKTPVHIQHICWLSLCAWECGSVNHNGPFKDGVESKASRDNDCGERNALGLTEELQWIVWEHPGQLPGGGELESF